MRITKQSVRWHKSRGLTRLLAELERTSEGQVAAKVSTLSLPNDLRARIQVRVDAFVAAR